MAYYVYLLASRKDGALYVGVTNDLVRRSTSIDQGRSGLYVALQHHRLVWFEVYDDPISAITREKEIKKWRRDWKIA